MYCKTLAIALLAAPLSLPLSQFVGSGSAPNQNDISESLSEAGQPGCPNLLAIEPLVVFNVSGSTLMGTVQKNLAVYNNGFVMYSHLGRGGLQQVGGIGGVTAAAAKNIGLAEVQQLLTDLKRAGAADLCDQETYVSDMPLQTLTIMNGRTDCGAHTFSFWLGIDEFSNVSGVMNEFMATHFRGI